MSFVIAMRGAQSEKIVGGIPRQVIPFVGADCEGEYAQMGVGIAYPDEQGGTIWGLIMPHALIQSWRGMRLLEQIGRIDQSTLCACWTVMQHNIHGGSRYYLDELAKQVGGVEKLETIRNELLASVPSIDELNDMITCFREKGVGVDSWELEAEVKAGRLAMTPLIEELIRETDECQQAYKRVEEDANKPLLIEERPDVTRQGFFGRIAAFFRS